MTTDYFKIVTMKHAFTGTGGLSNPQDTPTKMNKIPKPQT